MGLAGILQGAGGHRENMVRGQKVRRKNQGAGGAGGLELRGTTGTLSPCQAARLLSVHVFSGHAGDRAPATNPSNGVAGRQAPLHVSL